MKKIYSFLILSFFTLAMFAQDSIQLPKEYPFGAPGTSSRGTFGEDDRKEVRDAVGYEDFVRATAVMVPKEMIRGNRIYGYNLRELLEIQFQTSKFDENVKFLDQPTIGMCTGFLIAPDILVTAGHCLTTMEQAKDYVWLFNYTNEMYYDSKGRYITVDPENVFEAKEILGAEFQEDEGDIDYAVLRLDRKSTRRPYRFRTSGTVASGTPINTIGSPTGLPLKFATNATVTDTDPTYWFKSNIDSFPGNSGGPVFDQNGFIEGILVRGAAEYTNTGLRSDYKLDPECECIKTVGWESVEFTAGCQAHKIASLPAKILIDAVYENLDHAIVYDLKDRFKDWERYNWIFNRKFTGDRTPLEERALASGNTWALEKILSYSAEKLTDEEARRLLEFSFYMGNMNAFEIVLKSGLYPDAGMDNNNSLLQVAVQKSKPEAVKLLLGYGANIHVQDSNKNTLLHVAAERGDNETIAILLKNGIRSDVKNKRGSYADKVARKAGHKKLGRYLKKVRKGRIEV